MNVKKVLMGGGIATAIALVAFAGISIASAALTFSGTSITGDSNSVIDATGTISIGANSATGITIGQLGQTVLFPGNISSTNLFIGNGTTTNLSITGLGTSGSPCLTVNAAGNVATTTCGGSSSTSSNFWSATSTIIGGYSGSAATAKISLAAMPNLSKLIATYRRDLFAPVWLVNTGSSVDCGATLSNAAVQAPGNYLEAQLAQQLDPAGNYSTFPWQPHDINFQLANFCVNGGFAGGFTGTLWTSFMAGAPSAYTVANGGSGYNVGDLVVIYQGTCNDNNPANPPAPLSTCNGEATAVVTAVSTGGIVTALQPSAYPNYELDTALAAVTYTTGTAIPTANGYAHGVALAGQKGTGTGLTVNITSVGIAPTVVSSLWGTNDLTPNGFNGFTGYSYSTFVQGFKQFLNTVTEPTTVGGLGADAIVLTAPHPTVDGAYAGSYTWTGTKSQIYPTTASVTDLTVFPSLSQATETAYFASGYPTTSITADTRFLWGNQMMRSVAGQYHAQVIDIEHAYFNAIAAQIATSGTQAAAETVFYGSGGTVHPAQAGANAFYYPPINWALSGLANSPEQPGTGSMYPLSPPSGGVVDYGPSLFNLGVISSASTTFTLSPLTSGTLTVYAQEYNFPSTVGIYAFNTCSGFAKIGSDAGTNAYASNPLFSLSATGLTVTVTAGYSSTYLQYEINNLSTSNNCPSSGSSSVQSPFALNTGTVNANKVNGATIPSSTALLATNSSSQIVSSGRGLLPISASSVGASSTVTFSLPANSGGVIDILALQNGVTQPQFYWNTFSAHSSTAYLGTAAGVGAGTMFTVSISGLTVTITNIYSGTGYSGYVLY